MSIYPIKKCELHYITHMHAPTGGQKYTMGMGRNALRLNIHKIARTLAIHLSPQLWIL